MTDYRQCLACGVDFEPNDPPGRGPRQVYCKTKRCIRDRDMEAKGRYYAKLDPRARIGIMGKSTTAISTGHCRGGRRRQERDEL